MDVMNILLTGGAGFIGSAVAHEIIRHSPHRLLVVDKLTYAGNPESLAEIAADPRFAFEHLDICDRAGLHRAFSAFRPDIVMHLAAETHVDRSIDGPAEFINSNIVGTYNLLEAARSYFGELAGEAKARFRFLGVSTDEVYGDLGGPDGFFHEDTPYCPSSPYSASKAAADHLVRAWNRTYGLPTVVTNCSNNYGPRQFPEKLIPLMILNALEEKPLPVYGDGGQIRDWLFVEDHARALLLAALSGRPGESYNIGAREEKTNLEVVTAICSRLDRLKPRPDGKSYTGLIIRVPDRPGHDRRYAIDNTKIRRELGWEPCETWAGGLDKTVQWYLNNRESWCRHVADGTYRRERLGLGGKA